MVATHIGDGKKRKVTDTDTTNGNDPKKLLINRLIPEIIPSVILPAPQNADRVAASSANLHTHQSIRSKENVTDAARRGARVFKYPTMVNWNYRDGTIPRDANTVGIVEILNIPIMIGYGTSFSPTRRGSQEIGSPSGSIGPQEVRDAQQLDTSINGIYDKHRDPAPNFSKVIGRKLSEKSSANICSRCRMNLTRDSVFTESPNFMNLGLSYDHTSDELGSVSIPTKKIGRSTDGSNWLLPDHLIGEVTPDRASRTRL